jgi:hypothetical protein
MVNAAACVVNLECGAHSNRLHVVGARVDGLKQADWVQSAHAALNGM